MDGLVGVQRREVGVHFTVILSNVETVGIHILTADARKQRSYSRSPLKDDDSCNVSGLT